MVDKMSKNDKREEIIINPQLKICETFKKDIKEGLSKEQKAIPSMYFYDDAGSEIFKQIMALTEYYPTNCEIEILNTIKSKIIKYIKNRPFNLIELGAGDGKKTKILLKEFIKRKLNFQYLIIDISNSAAEELKTSLCIDFPSLEVKKIVAEYFDGLKTIKLNSNRCNFVLFLGSNVGNILPLEQIAFFKRIEKAIRSKDLLLVGFDLKKDREILKLAYDDPHGVTKNFNLNLLKRMNCELGANFNISKFKHSPIYNSETGD